LEKEKLRASLEQAQLQTQQAQTQTQSLASKKPVEKSIAMSDFILLQGLINILSRLKVILRLFFA
jgi:hypothetical protein